MKLTPEVLRNLYATLCCCYPFTKWNMPLPEEVEFVVSPDPETMGTYMYDEGEKHEHTVTISASRCGFYETVVKTIAHEMNVLYTDKKPILNRIFENKNL